MSKITESKRKGGHGPCRSGDTPPRPTCAPPSQVSRVEVTVLQSGLDAVDARLASLEAFAEAVRGEVQTISNLAKDVLEADDMNPNLFIVTMRRFAGNVAAAIAKLDGKEGGMSDQLKIEQLHDEECVVIEGMRYSFALFRDFAAGGLAIGEPFVIEQRDDDGTLWVRRLDQEIATLRARVEELEGALKNIRKHIENIAPNSGAELTIDRIAEAALAGGGKEGEDG